jgi:hypothetical protein
MSQNDSIALRENLSLDSGGQESRDIEQDALSLDQEGPRQQESSRNRAFVLVGSSILQLPIWGKLTATS